MHELPHGGNTSKARLNRIKYLPLLLAPWFEHNRTIFLGLWTLTALIAIYLHEPKIEPKLKIERKTEKENLYIVPLEYRADRDRIIHMYYNAKTKMQK